MFVKLQAQLRNQFTKSGLHKLRAAGKVPAVLYGKQSESVALTIDERTMLQLLREHPNALIELEVAGQFRKTVVIQEVQRDAFTRKILSVGFHQVRMDEAVKFPVHLELHLEPRDKDLKYQMLLHELEVQCLPDQIPASIPVDAEMLRRGKPVLVRDVRLPEGVKVLNPAEEVIAAPLHITVRQEESTGALDSAESA